MKRHLKLLFFIFCTSTACLAYNEQPTLTKSSISDRLEQPTVSAIYRDIEGVLWIGTQQGLYRYDGAILSVFNANKANKYWIPESEIKDISGDDNGNVFVATSSGALLIWNRQLQAFTAADNFDNTKNSRLVRMLVASNGYVWLLNQVGLSLHDPKSKETSKWVSEIEILKSIGTPQTITEDKSGNLWIGGNMGIIFINPKHQNILVPDLNKFDLPTNSSITALEVNHEGNLIIGTNSGQLLVWDTNEKSVLANLTLKGKGKIYISRILPYEDKIVVGTDSGLYISNKRLSFIDEIHGEISGATTVDVYSLHRDGKYIWVGKVNGLDILSFAASELFNMRNSGISNHVLSFTQDDKGRIWIGTYSGLFRYDEESQSHVRSGHNFESTKVTQEDQRVVALANKSDELWIGLFEGGVKKLNISSGIYKSLKHNRPTQVAVTKILLSDNKEDVWIATFDHGLFRINSEKIHSYIENRHLLEKSITSLFLSDTGILFAISGNRVYQYELKTDQFSEIPFDFGLGITKPFVYSVAQSIKNDIIIGTKDHGLFIWPRKDQIKNQFELRSTPPETSLATSTIYGIEIDSTGNLWCSTQNGVIKLSPEGRLIKRFTTADGLQGNDFTLGASFKSRQGLIYFGGTDGYNRFDPNEIEIDNTPSPMRLTGISLPTLDERNLGEVSDLESLQLTHKDRFVTFQFSVLDFIDTERNQFRYILEKFDANWIENGTGNTATYTNLPTGDYVFRVQGANSAGIWNREGIALNVTVLPAPWLTWWAYSLYGLALTCLFWGMHRIYRSYAIERRSAQLALEMFESENRADDDMQEQLELQDELVRSAYQHNLTTLGLVSDFIRLRSTNQPETTNRELAENTIERISALYGLEDCLSYQAGGPVANLYQYTEEIFPKLLKCSPVSPESIITINEVASLPIPAELASPISIIIYELLENCIQHAFQPGSPANYIHVKFTPDESLDSGAHRIELSVHDSGIGISDSIESLARKGRGIAIVQFIAKKLGGQLKLSQGNGTKICLIVPNTGNL